MSWFIGMPGIMTMGSIAGPIVGLLPAKTGPLPPRTKPSPTTSLPTMRAKEQNMRRHYIGGSGSLKDALSRDLLSRTSEATAPFSANPGARPGAMRRKSENLWDCTDVWRTGCPPNHRVSYDFIRAQEMPFNAIKHGVLCNSEFQHVSGQCARSRSQSGTESGAGTVRRRLGHGEANTQ